MANEFKIKKGLIVTGADGGTAVDVQGSQGQLFSVTDDLSGSIFAVSDISGVPILDVNSDGTIQFSDLGAGTLVTDANGNISVSSGGGAGGPYLPLAGGTMTGDLLMDGKAGVGNVIGLATGTSSNAMSLKLYTYNNIDPGGGLGTSTGNMIQADLGSNLVLRQTANDGDITFQSDDGAGGIATYLTLDGSSTDAYFSNPGNVGIGVTSPGARLDVAGNGNAIQIRRSNGFASIKAHSDNGGNLVLDSLSTAGAVFLNHYVNRPVYIASGGGNVGIGTTSPVRKLTVNGSANVFDSLLINSNTPTTGATTDAELVIQAKGNQAGTIRSSQWYFQTIPDSIYGNSAFRIAKNYDGGATSEFMRITSAGNVGIGTTSSDYKLEVNGSLGVSRTDGIVFAGSAGAGTGSKILSNTSNDLIFSTALTSIPYTTTERVRVLNNGNVGIGTTSPADKLEVKDGSIRLNSTSSYPSTNVIKATWNGSTSPPMGSIGWEQNPGFIGSEWSHYKQTSPYTQARIRLIGDASSGGMFVNLNGSDVFTIKTSTSNVGIGTTNPTSQLGSTKVLDISSTGNGEIILDHTDAGVSSDIGLYSWNRNNDHLAHIKASCDGATDSAFISFHTQATGGSFANASSNERMRITSNGNVGIGTSTPLYLLDAAGTIRCTSLIQTSQSDKKENIGNIDKSKPKAIPFKEYRYKSDIDSTGRKRYGVLAEDIENDYPELVYVDSNGDKAVNYIDLLVKRVAELEKELEDISLTPGPKGDTGATGATGPQGPAGTNGTNGKDGVNGNDHLKNVQSITFNERTGQLEITIEGYKDPFKFNPDK